MDGHTRVSFLTDAFIRIVCRLPKNYSSPAAEKTAGTSAQQHHPVPVESRFCPPNGTMP
jgi:hypothetical protein